MSSKKMTRLTLSAAIAASLMSGAVMAQDANQSQPPAPAGAPQPTPKDTKTLDQVVVTGTATYGGVKKINASYSITTADSTQIQQFNPRSSADLLKLSPGVWPESTGGQTGANIEIAGFPGGGDAPFYTNQIMGVPLYGMPSLSFFEQSSMFRLDDTVDHVELLQGGPSVVFSDGQIGLTSNYILKQGTETPSGDIGVTYGSGDLRRIDGFIGFPIAPNWYGSVGGFYRDSNGIRDPQFAADKGGQLTATLTHDFDGGSFMLWTRYLNDRNQFITPIPLVQSGADNFSGYPGFDPLTSTYYSSAMQHVYLEDYPGGGKYANLADGRGARLGFLGGNYNQDLGDGWSINDKFIIDGGDMDTNALFSGSNPETLNAWLAGNDVPTGATVNANYTNSGAAVGNYNQSVISQGWWSVHKNIKSVINDFRVSKELFDGNTLTAGIYLAHYTDNDRWSLGNPMLMTNTPNATPIAVSYVQNGQTYYVTDAQGLMFNGNYGIEENGVATNKAFYLSDNWTVGQWIIDASGRVENENASNNVCAPGAPFDMDGNPYTLYDNAVTVCQGSFARTSYDKTHPSWTVGAMYKIQDNMGVYVRANRGAHFNSFDDLRGSTTGDTPPLLTIQNFQVGFKYQMPYFSSDVSYYHRQFNGLSYQPSLNGFPFGSKLSYGSDTKGLNFVMTASTPDQYFSVTWSGDWMDGHYSHYAGNVEFAGLPTPDNPSGIFYTTINGQQLQRQPKFQFRLMPTVRIPTPYGDVRLWATWEHVGNRTQDQTGLQQLGSYDDYSIGAQYNYGDHWQFTLTGANVTNELGITESNSRIAGSAAGSNGVILARPMEGHDYQFQAKYNF